LTIEKGLSQFPALSINNRPATAGKWAIFAICQLQHPPNIRALACHAVILSTAKNLALDFSVKKRQGEMLRCAQHDSAKT
jgi:hypothetical protein